MRGWIAAILIGLIPPGALAQPAGPPAPTPGAASAPAPEAAPRPRSPAQLARQQRMRDCNAEARSRDLAAEGRRGFMRECLSNAPRPAGDAAAAPPANRRAAAPSSARTDTPTPGRAEAPAPDRAAEAPAGSRATASRTAALASNAPTFTTEAAARAACGDEPVVWGNSDSRIFHVPGSRLYGHTQYGAYLCRGPAELAGYRAAR